jgi:hypothetical protein
MQPRPARPGPAIPPLPGGDRSAAVVTELEVRGEWSRSLGMDTTRRLRERLSAGPAAIIIDLHPLLDPEAASLPLWLATRRAASVLRPPVHLALCLAVATVLETRLRRLGAYRLPTFATMPEARDAMTDRLLRDPPSHGQPSGGP